MTERPAASDDPAALIHAAGEALLAAVLQVGSGESSRVDGHNPLSRSLIDDLARLPSLIALLAHVHTETQTGAIGIEVDVHAAQLTSALVARRPLPHPRTSYLP